MTQLEGFKELFKCVFSDKYRHEYYERTVKLAEEYYMLSTGVGIDVKLRQMSSRESDEAFRERKKITINIISSIVSNLTHIFNRVPRSNGVRLKYYSVNNDEKTLKDFNNILDNYSERGFANYFENRIKTLIEVDPNAWLVTEFESTDGSTYALPYPKEVYSKNALNYKFKNAELLFLCTGPHKPTTSGDATQDKYVVYTKEGAVIIQREAEDKGYYELKDVTDFTEIPEAFNIRNRSYVVIVPDPYNLEYIPATFIGYIMDKQTAGKTFVNMYDAVVPFLEKLIKVNSEQDVSMAKHVHMQKIQYVRKCTNVDNGCHCGSDGYYYTDVEDTIKCSVCKGRGFIDITTGGMEVIYLPMPETKDEILDLNNIVQYIGVPIDTPKWQTEYIDHITELCKQVMYNSDIFGRDEIADTATAKIIELQNVYDTLYPYALNYARLWGDTITTIADITDFTDKISVSASASKDFKLETKAELISMLKLATDAGASDIIIRAINDEIAFAFYGDTDNYRRYELQQKLLPFQNKSKEQQMLILSMLPRDSYYFAAFEFGQEIIKELEAEHMTFYDFPFDRQKNLFDEKVNEKAAMMKVEQPTFNGLI